MNFVVVKFCRVTSLNSCLAAIVGIVLFLKMILTLDVIISLFVKLLLLKSWKVDYQLISRGDNFVENETELFSDI